VSYFGPMYQLLRGGLKPINGAFHFFFYKFELLNGLQMAMFEAYDYDPGVFDT